MNAVGIFAGRGDVILAMGLSLLVGGWVGFKLNQFVAWINHFRKRT